MMRPDLERHLFFGMLIQFAIASGIRFLDLALPGFLPPLLAEHPIAVGWTAGVLAGVGKELVWDLALARGQPDPSDAGATVFGATLSAFLLVVW